VTVDQPPDDNGSDRVPLRWVVIFGLSTAIAVMTGTTEGVALGILAGLATAATLHTIMN
jgi:hypothetical protein